MLRGLINTGSGSAVEQVRVDLVQVDGGTQMRAGLDARTVEEYAAVMAEAGWGAFPPIICFHDGSQYWLADGFHRLAAFRSLAAVGDALVPADVRSGTRRDAVLFAAGANASHGLRRTNADKRRAVEVMLRDEEWSKWSDREIGRQCNVSADLVGTVRKQFYLSETIDRPAERTVQRGGQTYVQNTANIGGSRPVARYESGLPVLDVPMPGAPAKLPIEDWELEEIVGQVTAEYYGAAVKGVEMVREVQSQAGAYWEKLRAVLAPFDVTQGRIEGAVVKAAEGERRAAIAPGSPEARALTREIKAGTWGDRPFVAVWEIERAIGEWAKELTPGELRTLARYRGGASWFDCRVALGEMQYRDRDLVQALNNLAAQKEQRAEGETGREGEGETVDPWVAVWKDGRGHGTLEEGQRRQAALAAAMQEWVLAWTDDKGRTWRDVADRSPYHANSPFRQDLHAECRRRGLLLYGEVLGSVIVEIFSNLAAVEVPVVAAEDPEADEEVLAAVEVPEDLVATWAPRFDGGAGVYLVDVVRNRSTETVGLDEIEELWAQARRMDGALDEELTADGAEEETLTGDDLRVMQAAPRVTVVALTATTLADVLRPAVTQFYEDGSDTWQQWAARDIRLNTGREGGAFWRRCVATLDSSQYRQHEHWTTGLLRVALEMLADELPGMPLTPPIAPPVRVPLKPAPDDRIGRARRLIAGYQATIATFDEYGDLVGAYTEPMPAKRELEKLIRHLEREVSLLEGKVVEEAWG